MKNLMELFEEYRKKTGLSMNQLADLVGIDVSYYSRLVNGHRESLNIIVAAEVTKTLNVPPKLFLESIGIDDWIN